MRRENRALDGDLGAASDEIHRLTEDIQQLIHERKQLAQQVQDYVAEVRRVEDVLAQKVRVIS